MSAQPNAAALVAVDETAASSSKSTSKSKSKNKSKSDKAANAEQLQQYDQEQRRLRSLLAWCEASSERHFAQPNGVVPNLWEEYRELLGKVQELRKAETEQYGETLAQAWNTWGRGSTGPDTLPSRFAAFERWFVQETVAHGGGSAQLAADGKHLDAIEFVFANAEQGNGVIARRDIPAGQTFINVPEALMMTAEKARKSETFQLITSGALDSTELSPAMAKLDNFLLRMFLIVERRRGGNSYWSPYIDLLPQRFRLPLYFTEAELELLKPSPALQEAFVQLRNVVRQYAAWKQYLMMLELARAAELPSGSGDAHQKILDQRRRAQAMPVRYNELTYDLFCWASSAVATRQNQIVVGEVRANQAPELSLALIPGWDMCNHAFGGASSFYDTQTRSLECVAVAPIAKGEPVLLHYGDRSSMAYFGNSEFVPADHPTDQYLILLAVGKQDPLFKSKSTILQALGVKE
ncbi:hypothetical protein CAOG_03170 [Capsaspora owczarzaki ATCC 30864]|nr:hypothetical protein CAOG_03170 [Capsaspora owczarzaki ATCC 30864]|eukprot:XP_004364009.1 hypothetical protein CAOG_03170 [Capsaspora owczarzaki ATCC 30864]